MGAVATFSFPTFAARYPEFAPLDPTLAGLYFSEATLYLANDGSGPVADAGQQLTLLNMLTAHIAKLNATIGGVAPSGLVGRIAGATEGSVSVSTDLTGLPGSAAWFTQTPYGLSAWQAMARYRTARYIPGFPRPSYSPFAYGRF